MVATMIFLRKMIVLACRNETKALIAISKLKEECPKANLMFMKIDLNDLNFHFSPLGT